MREPRERGVLFNGEMVRAIIAGTKTQTRRPIKPSWWRCLDPDDSDGVAQALTMCPLGCVGDLLYVRETFCIETNYDVRELDYEPPFTDGRPVRRHADACDGEWWEQPHYRATDPTPELSLPGIDGPGCRWTPSIHMPRWASRITLRVTDVRVQRVQDISEEDARAEGMPAPDEIEWTRREHFVQLWERTYRNWLDNPWVWAVTFEVVKP